MNNENLKPISSTSEAREKGSKGGIRSGEVRREKKKFKELLEIALSGTIKSKQGEEKEVKEAIMLKVIQKALKGDQKAVDYITKMIEEEPVTKHELIGEQLIQKVFVTQADKKEINKKIDKMLNE